MMMMMIMEIVSGLVDYLIIIFLNFKSIQIFVKTVFRIQQQKHFFYINKNAFNFKQNKNCGFLLLPTKNSFNKHLRVLNNFFFTFFEIVW